MLAGMDMVVRGNGALLYVRGTALEKRAAAEQVWHDTVWMRRSASKAQRHSAEAMRVRNHRVQSMQRQSYDRTQSARGCHVHMADGAGATPRDFEQESAWLALLTICRRTRALLRVMFL